MKTLIIINEPLANMALGSNSTLSYILSCVTLGHEVHIYNLKGSLPKTANGSVTTFCLSDHSGLCNDLVKNYCDINEKIMGHVAGNDLSKLQNLQVKKVADFLPKKLPLRKAKISEFKFVVQRLEPMKAPFPPKGKKDVNQILRQLKALFPNLIFNCPIGLSDKEIPQEINQILGQEIATPTAEFSLTDKSFLQFSQAIKSTTEEYQKIYKSTAMKLVFKPKNSAQSLGVFSVELSEKGLDLIELQKKKVAELKSFQSYQIKSGISAKELKKIIEILCCVQNVKENKVLKNVAAEEVLSAAQDLYGDKILIQPFLEGVRSGDVRVNIFKDAKGDFYVAGQAFRKSLRTTDRVFTTAFSTGSAVVQPVEVLTKNEQKDLIKKNAAILKIFNGKLRKKYCDSIELGVDFILVGDGKKVLLGEVNHHCPGLIPLSEAVGKSANQNAFYQKGLGLTTRAVQDVIKMQKR